MSAVNGTLHLNWSKDDPKPARPRNGMSAMEEAFARAGYRPAPRPPPQSPPPPDRAAAANRRADAIKSEIAEATAAFKAMSDDELFAEKLSIEANIAVIKIDLTEVVADGRDRSPGWQYRAERALTFIKARYAACVAEGEARRKQQRAHTPERQQAHRELVEQAQQRKLETAQAKQELDRTDAEAFKMVAKAVLPRETWLAIWAAVEAGKAAASTSPESPTEGPYDALRSSHPEALAK